MGEGREGGRGYGRETKGGYEGGGEGQGGWRRGRDNEVQEKGGKRIGMEGEVGEEERGIETNRMGEVECDERHTALHSLGMGKAAAPAAAAAVPWMSHQP